MHVNKRICPKCNEIMAQARRELIQFAAYVRAAHPDAHVSCAYRGEAAQNEAYAKGFSGLKWPDSKHNKTPAEALDWFHLDKFGHAIWDNKWLKAVLQDAAATFGLEWGGNWRKPDCPHVEFPDPKD